MDNSPIMVKLDPKHINFLNQIMEGYEYLGVVSTLKSKKTNEGTVVIRVTADTAGEVREILANLPFDFEYL